MAGVSDAARCPLSYPWRRRACPKLSHKRRPLRPGLRPVTARGRSRRRRPRSAWPCRSRCGGIDDERDVRGVVAVAIEASAEPVELDHVRVAPVTKQHRQLEAVAAHALEWKASAVPRPRPRRPGFAARVAERAKRGSADADGQARPFESVARIQASAAARVRQAAFAVMSQADTPRYERGYAGRDRGVNQREPFASVRRRPPNAKCPLVPAANVTSPCGSVCAGCNSGAPPPQAVSRPTTSASLAAPALELTCGTARPIAFASARFFSSASSG